ncbi:hypothetical protein [Nitrospirillum amazonense]|uniref:hypothetical protein n=1 Tax=Nitrospirillum amazonense TaxID=28077 RepID=UPI0024121EDA|nr:hypothetical protein [Nitrospirillum amazonense]MDG3444538.1 hypothetical protein [Nitrospirillum amazonense]
MSTPKKWIKNIGSVSTAAGLALLIWSAAVGRTYAGAQAQAGMAWLVEASQSELLWASWGLWGGLLSLALLIWALRGEQPANWLPANRTANAVYLAVVDAGSNVGLVLVGLPLLWCRGSLPDWGALIFEHAINDPVEMVADLILGGQITVGVLFVVQLSLELTGLHFPSFSRYSKE